MSTYIIYRTTNILDGKYYIGQHKQETSEFDGYLGSGLRLTNSILKYGKQNFIRETLEVCDENIVNEREIFWIKELSATNRELGYNISSGGDGGNIAPWTKERREKIGLKNKGKIISEQQKEKFRIKMIGQKRTEKTKQNISKSLIGKNIGKIRTKEFKQNISNKLKGRKYSKEHKQRISLSKRGYKNPSTKWIYTLSNGLNFYDYFSKKERHTIKENFRRRNTSRIEYKDVIINKISKKEFTNE